jgi:hypothetical protein
MLSVVTGVVEVTIKDGVDKWHNKNNKLKINYSIMYS